MNKQFIVNIQKEESDTMEKIYDKLCALKSLGFTLIDNNTYADKATEFYSRLVNDMTNTNAEYTKEWEKLISKYSLNPDLANKYEVSFSDVCIYLNK